MLIILSLVELIFLFDFRKRNISFNLFVFLTLIFITAIYFTIELDFLDSISKYMGFELTSNFVLFILVLVSLMINYITILKIEKMKKQLKKIVFENALKTYE